MRLTVLVAVCGVLCGPVAASAQNLPGGLFVDGGVFLGVEGQGSFSDPTLVGRDAEEWQSVAGGQFAAGTFLVPRVSLRVEAAFLGSTNIIETSSSAIVVTGLSEALSQSSDSNTQSFSALLGFHPMATGRWSVAFVGGVAFNRQSFHAVVTTTIPGLPPLLPPRSSSYEANAVSYDPSAIVGSDVAARLSAHLSVVGQIRVLAFATDIHIRPGVVLRWTR